MAEKVTGKDLKELRKPDEFQIVGGRSMDFLIRHQKQLLLAAVAFVVVVAVAWGAAAWKSRSEGKAGESLAEALRVAARPVAGEGIAQPGEETFPTKADRNKAATDAFEKVRADHKGTTAAQTATLQLGFLKQQTGDAAGAVALIEEYLKAAPSGHPLRAAALESLGYAQEAQGKLAEAKDSFGKMKDAGAPERSAFQLARIALVENKPEAKDLLAAVAKDYPKEPVALEANQRLEVAGLPEAKPGEVKAAAPDASKAPDAAVAPAKTPAKAVKAKAPPAKKKSR